MNLWIGTSGFRYPEWKAGFYPEKISVAKMLAYYAERFPTTESNYSFRRIPSEKTFAAWANGTPEQFRSSFKAPEKVTHFAKLRNCADTMEYFHQRMLGLGEKRGAVLFQLPPTFRKDTDRLTEFLQILPKDIKAAFEFRHESWFDGELFSLLRNPEPPACGLPQGIKNLVHPYDLDLANLLHQFP